MGLTSVGMQYGHSAARYNEAMSQIAVDKDRNFLRETQDRWLMTMKSLKPLVE